VRIERFDADIERFCRGGLLNRIELG